MASFLYSQKGLMMPMMLEVSKQLGRVIPQNGWMVKKAAETCHLEPGWSCG
jgi:hypothetical protein